jgi:hypothetical protein
MAKARRPRHLSVTGAGCDVNEGWGPLPSVRERAATSPWRTKGLHRAGSGGGSREVHSCAFAASNHGWGLVGLRPPSRRAALRWTPRLDLPPLAPPVPLGLPSSLPSARPDGPASFLVLGALPCLGRRSAFPCSSLEVLQRTRPSVGSSVGLATPGGCPPSVRVPSLTRAVLVVLPHLDGFPSRQPAGLLHPAADPGVHRVDEERCGCSCLLRASRCLTLPSFAQPSQHPVALRDLLAPSPLRTRPLRGFRSTSRPCSGAVAGTPDLRSRVGSALPDSPGLP